MSRREFWFALASVEGIGPMRIKRLLSRFGSVEEVFEAELSEIARLPFFNPILATRVLKAKVRLAEFRRQMKWFKTRGIEILCLEDEDYPSLLQKISNPPAILCKKGNLPRVPQQAVAIVGTTNPSETGILTTIELSTRLSQAGFTIVSGLARGIDTAAHVGALSANGITVAVLSCDLLSVYPEENRQLASQISETGALFSEHPFASQPTPANLVQRNRIVSGLATAVIVVESGRDGGTIRTAEFASKQERLVLACNWSEQHRLTEGPRYLIQQGALPIEPDQLDRVVELLTDPDRQNVEPANAGVKQMQLF